MSGPEIALLLALGLGVYLSIWLHELGHGLLARWAGLDVFALGVGAPPVISLGRLGRTRLFLGRGRILQGMTLFFSPRLLPEVRHSLGALAGGILANLLGLCGALLLLHTLSWGQPLWVLLALANASLALGNAVPYTIRRGAFWVVSDGAQLLQILRNGELWSPPEQRLVSLPGVHALVEQLGCPEARGGLGLVEAGAWLSLGAPERAREICGAALPLVTRRSADQQVGLARLQALIAIDLDQPDLAAQHLARGAVEAHSPAARLLLDLAQAELSLLQEAPGPGLRRLAVLRQDPLIARRRASQAQLSVRIIRALARGGHQTAAEAECVRYTSTPTRSAAHELAVWLAMGEMYARLGFWPSAEDAALAAVDPLKLLVSVLTRAPAVDGALPAADRLRQLASQVTTHTGTQVWDPALDAQLLALGRPEPEQSWNQRLHGMVQTCFALLSLFVFWLGAMPPASPSLLALVGLVLGMLASALSLLAMGLCADGGWAQRLLLVLAALIVAGAWVLACLGG